MASRHVSWTCPAERPYLAVQLLVQLTDALRQLCKLLSNDSMVDGLSSVCLHIEVLRQKIPVALWKNRDVLQCVSFFRGWEGSEETKAN